MPKLLLFSALAALAVSVAAVVLLMGGSATSLAQNEGGSNVNRTISVTGQGAVSAVPDVLKAQIGVETEDQNLSEALAANNTRMSAVLAKLKDLGLAKEDVQTVNFFISDRRDRDGNITGFAVSNAVQVTIRDLDQAGAVLDAAVQAGANRVSSVQLALGDPDPLVEQARKLAVQAAQARAAQLAQAAGMTLGKPLTISESSGGGFRSTARVAALAAEAVPIAEGQLSITVNVSITFEMS